MEATKFKRKYGLPYPPFTFFVSFIRDLAKQKNDPSLIFDVTLPAQSLKGQPKREKTTPRFVTILL